MLKPSLCLSCLLLMQSMTVFAANPPVADAEARAASQTSTAKKVSRVASGQMQDIPSPRRPKIVQERPGSVSKASQATSEHTASAAAVNADDKVLRPVRKPPLPDKSQ